MKHIFRKNQIIVTALALMIAAAGYVNYTYNMSEEDLASKAVDGEDDTMETAATTLSEDEIFYRYGGRYRWGRCRKRAECGYGR